jgi:hypothetical protein
MPFKLYDYVDTRGKNKFKEWCESLTKVERIKLNERLDKLELHGPVMRPHVLAGTGIGGLEKLRVQGNTKLRPLLTEGPLNVGDEFTLLLGAREIGSKWVPATAKAEAEANKQAVINQGATRRKDHEKVK